ncbi:PREDICTED: uncharacterized protein LOC108569088, partial [Nicrophorus vespilloides]|uniref:Uncharacterized protein LOC108569088 n=1 Tax=Nicrophorus vespilloides TaxID=110193 RepID=A0ABM1NGN5_NICVS
DEPDVRRCRSKSDGAPITPGNEQEEPYEVFPHLPDSVLEKLGLLGDSPRERLTDEELEQKFISLSLAFTIDADTIKDRCNRQRRYRDQTETNLNVEIERLIERANRLYPLCIDAETTELLAALLAQVDIIVRASSHAAISAERFGAVQHEERLAESVQLMIKHVNVLKRQRDSARRQLQYTKRVLQDTNSAESSSPKLKTPQLNGRVITRRRASIATISQPHQENSNKVVLSDSRRMIRRTSELSLRGSILNRTARPSRLELGLDLVKIREGTVETIIMPSVVDEENDDEIEDVETNSYQSNDESGDSKATSRKVSTASEPDLHTFLFKDKLLYKGRKLGRAAKRIFNNWLENGSSNEVFCFCALICFSLSIITMGNILMEFECAKRGDSNAFFCWNYTSTPIYTDNQATSNAIS